MPFLFPVVPLTSRVVDEQDHSDRGHREDGPRRPREPHALARLCRDLGRALLHRPRRDCRHGMNPLCHKRYVLPFHAIVQLLRWLLVNCNLKYGCKESIVMEWRAPPRCSSSRTPTRSSWTLSWSPWPSRTRRGTRTSRRRWSKPNKPADESGD